ncbi:YfaZ family outer membrane protein [Thiomicrorhabdus sp. ZW0627]|uniref:YfaZ family outer membrane protein n=1 Tax=Thiomicrorhabdus sp. ZW0627 TaxID=3039774 RepID=UPI0024373C26|nr:YfaZ family outer membrane protein [Thiomicrorhabdus sp. ZW0627]MDG6774575.1 YfaZ family outer membrane protein [Thiomicrorhabdus sp. ZW0627]
MRTKSTLKAALLSVCTLLITPVHADSVGLDLAVSDETANFGIFTQSQSPVDSSRYAAHYFYNEPGDRVYSVSADVQRKGMAGNPNLELGLKGKGFYFTQDSFNLDGFGLMLGVVGRYWLPTQSPASVSVEALYAPEIVTSGDANSMTEMSVRADLHILPNVVGFVGFRYLVGDLKADSNYEFDKNAHIGVEVSLN